MAVEGLKHKHPHWRNFWMQAIVVKHNHYAVIKSLDRGKATALRLMKLLGDYTDAPVSR